MAESGGNQRFLVLICEREVRGVFPLQARRENANANCFVVVVVVVVNRRFHRRVLVVNVTGRAVTSRNGIVAERRFRFVEVFVRGNGVVVRLYSGGGSGDLDGGGWPVVDGGEEGGIRRRVMVVVEFGGSDYGEDDEIEEDVEVRRSEAREEEGPQVRGLVEEEMREQRECEFQTHCHR